MKHLIIVLLLAGCAAQPFRGGPLSSPTVIGEASPTPTTPLKKIGGFLGGVPANTTETLNLYTRSFDRIAFETELDGPDPWVRKFNGPVRYNFNQLSDDEITSWLEVAYVLGRLTGIEHVYIKDMKTELLTEDAGKSEFVIPKQAGGVVIRRYNTSNLCAVFAIKTPVGAQKNGVLYGATVLIGKNNFTVQECLVEEMAQLMGLPNDSDIVAESKFRTDPKDKAPGLTWHDAILLRTLYDYRLKPGMPRATALPIVRTIIGELLAELNR